MTQLSAQHCHHRGGQNSSLLGEGAGSPLLTIVYILGFRAPHWLQHRKGTQARWLRRHAADASDLYLLLRQIEKEKCIKHTFLPGRFWNSSTDVQPAPELRSLRRVEAVLGGYHRNGVTRGASCISNFLLLIPFI